MELGPIQEWWLTRLELYPERQTDSILGHLTHDGYAACCLGEYYICYRLYNGESFDDLWTGGDLIDWDKDSDELEVLTNSWHELGLHSAEGDALETFANPDDDDKDTALYNSLAEANDCCVDWPTLAKIIRANPENFFSKSV